MWHVQRKITFRIGLYASIIVLAVAGLLLYRHVIDTKSRQSPLTVKVTGAVKFQTYYPNPLPDTYYYAQDSANVRNDILFYTVTNGEDKILVSEQAKPAKDLMLDSVVGLSPFSTPLGTAYGGNSGATPVAILATKAALITISGDAGVPQDIVNSVALALKPTR
jgi:hypothetical protein